MLYLIFFLSLFLFTTPAYSQTSSVDLNWADNSTDETSFGVRRCTGASCIPSTEIVIVGANTTFYTDPASNLTPATNYCYSVYAFNSAGVSVNSNIACVLTKALFTVVKAGTGGGAVTSAPVGINCGATCSFLFAGNASVVLTATPAAGSVFAGWTGVCTGIGSCTVTTDAAKSVTATFNLITAPLPPSNLTVQ